VNSLLNSTLDTFFPNGIAYEVACEPRLTCSADMFSFKSYLTRWMAQTTLVAPFTRDTILPVLKSSAIAAAKQCSGGTNGQMCGLSWSKGSVWDGTQGVGQQMAAMSVVFTNLLQFDNVQIGAPLTNSSGGTSAGNPNAGSQTPSDPAAIKPATPADRAGAGILTTLVLVSVAGLFSWMTI
jgi:mannan endo-1,6-alpha-mannosidase